ncbi:hypothetical protein KIPB_004818 [Kipferlia bialata]|uniref:Uncharacterized protein n=1 Tax=Kipferlia bialata TaxID=797122 RepID=A0A9K3GIJ0_9EUKA|nr:hypothetical protein KIPB_004818 [Kipferlia bialata]|eukprot:g4818.t1
MRLCLCLVALVGVCLCIIETFETEHWYDTWKVETRQVGGPPPMSGSIPLSPSVAERERDGASGSQGWFDPADIIIIGSHGYPISYDDHCKYESSDNTAVMPHGTHFMSDLTDWHGNTTLSYETSWTNSEGEGVMQFEYELHFVPHGKWFGVGQYLGDIYIKPTILWCKHNYHTDIHVTFPADPVNRGSTSDPIAGIEIQMTIENSYKSNSSGAYSYSWWLQGDGVWKPM